MLTETTVNALLAALRETHRRPPRRATKARFDYWRAAALYSRVPLLRGKDGAL